jgi:hypothetical protein
MATMPKQLDEVGEDQHEARGEGFVEGLDVGRDARHQSPDRRPIEECRWKLSGCA